MRYNPRIRHIYEAEPVNSADFLRKFNHNVPRDVINELANNKYDILLTLRCSIFPCIACGFFDK